MKKLKSYKSILFIGSESYDAPTITVIEGLNKLGWNIYTIDKPNINSWFCNKVIDTKKETIPDVDFVLSNLHWGTRWSFYDKFDLHRKINILIDGDDNPGIGDWQEKYRWHCSRYEMNVRDAVKELALSPYRWMEEMNTYKPDIIFSAQKAYTEKSTIYIPFGIHDQYYNVDENVKKKYLFTHIPGPGKNRTETRKILKVLKYTLCWKDKIWDEVVRGESFTDKRIESFVNNDPNVHSWHRWVMPKDYFHKLSQSKILIYPGVDHWPFWDSKRPWESIASGAAVLMREPSIDTSEFSICDIDRDFVYKDNFDLIKKIKCLKNNKNLDDKIDNFVNIGREKFSSIEIAKYFLKKVGINET